MNGVDFYIVCYYFARKVRQVTWTHIADCQRQRVDHHYTRLIGLFSAFCSIRKCCLLNELPLAPTVICTGYQLYRLPFATSAIRIVCHLGSSPRSSDATFTRLSSKRTLSLRPSFCLVCTLRAPFSKRERWRARSLRYQIVPDTPSQMQRTIADTERICSVPDNLDPIH